MAGQAAAVGTLGFELGFGAFGACAFGGGELVRGSELGLVVLAEVFAFACGVVADPAGLGAGVCFGLAGAAGLGAGSVPGIACGGERVGAFAGAALGVGAGGGGLVCGAGLDGGDLRGCVAAQLLERGGRGLGVICLVLCGISCGGGVFASRGEGLGEGVGLLTGFAGLGLGGDGRGLGAAAGSFGVGDLGADTGGVQACGLLPGGADQDGDLAGRGVERGKRLLLAGVHGAGCGGGDAGVVVVALGAVVAAEDPVPAAAWGGQRAPAAGTLADRGAAGGIVAAAGGLAGHRQLPAFLRAAAGTDFLFISPLM